MNILRKREDGEQAPTTRSPRSLGDIQREIEQAFDHAWDAFTSDKFPSFGIVPTWPAIDVAEDDTALTLRADLPGLDAKDLNVEVSRGGLTISGSRQEECKEEKQGFWRHERKSGSFSRTIALPSYADAAKVNARYEKGVLTVTVPKVPGEAPKRVTVQTS